MNAIKQEQLGLKTDITHQKVKRHPLNQNNIRKKMRDTALLPIGVFDSGMGGLTVLKALRKTLKRESFIYLGDTARLPYGTKSVDTVRSYATQMARVLVERQVKALVIACNTATIAALPHLKTILPDIPVMGVVEPGSKAAVAATKNKKIAVMATETTIASNNYQKIITSLLPQASLSVKACSVLVALAEEGMVSNAIAREALLHYFADFSDEDTILLGCTHFPVFKPLMTQLLPKNVVLVDSGDATAEALSNLLKTQNLLSNESAYNVTAQYLVTDSVARFQSVGEIFLGERINSAAIELIDV